MDAAFFCCYSSYCSQIHSISLTSRYNKSEFNQAKNKNKKEGKIQLSKQVGIAFENVQ